MKGTVGRLARLLAGNLVKILSLLLAVSLIAFVLVTASPVDPVQQYILGLGTAVSPEQRGADRGLLGRGPAARAALPLLALLRAARGPGRLLALPAAGGGDPCRAVWQFVWR